MRGMLTIAEFCTRYGVGKTRTYELMKSGELDSRTFGRRRLITLESALAWSAALPTGWPVTVARPAVPPSNEARIKHRN